jgi:hypothetical protein
VMEERAFVKSSGSGSTGFSSEGRELNSSGTVRSFLFVGVLVGFSVQLATRGFTLAYRINSMKIINCDYEQYR